MYWSDYSTWKILYWNSPWIWNELILEIYIYRIEYWNLECIIFILQLHWAKWKVKVFEKSYIILQIYSVNGYYTEMENSFLRHVCVPGHNRKNRAQAKVCMYVCIYIYVCVCVFMYICM